MVSRHVQSVGSLWLYSGATVRGDDGGSVAGAVDNAGGNGHPANTRIIDDEKPCPMSDSGVPVMLCGCIGWPTSKIAAATAGTFGNARRMVKMHCLVAGSAVQSARTGDFAAVVGRVFLKSLL